MSTLVTAGAAGMESKMHSGVSPHSTPVFAFLGEDPCQHNLHPFGSTSGLSTAKPPEADLGFGLLP